MVFVFNKKNTEAKQRLRWIRLTGTLINGNKQGWRCGKARFKFF